MSFQLCFQKLFASLSVIGVMPPWSVALTTLVAFVSFLVLFRGNNNYVFQDMDGATKILIIGASGGLGKALVAETLAKGFSVSVFVRNKEKLLEEAGKAAFDKLHVSVGDASNEQDVAAAMKGNSIVFLAVGANLPIAKAVSAAASKSAIKKLIGVAGMTFCVLDCQVNLKLQRCDECEAGRRSRLRV